MTTRGNLRHYIESHGERLERAHDAMGQSGKAANIKIGQAVKTGILYQPEDRYSRFCAARYLLSLALKARTSDRLRQFVDAETAMRAYLDSDPTLPPAARAPLTEALAAVSGGLNEAEAILGL